MPTIPEIPPDPFVTLVGTIGDIFSATIDWVGTVASTVTGSPLLLIGVIVGFVGLGVGLFKRLLRV